MTGAASIAAKAAAAKFLQFSLQWSSIAFLWHDYILTFKFEVKYMWSQKFRLSTLLYICCRYALVGNVIFLLAISQKLGDSCDVWYKSVSVMAQLGRAAIIASTLRTYAVWNSNRYILAYLSSIGSTCIILSFIHVPGVRCTGGFKNVFSLLPILMTLFETSIFCFTTLRCVKALFVHKGTFARSHGFFRLILEQGVLYFGVTSILAIATLILNYRAVPGTFFQRLLNGLNLPVSCLLTARFLLHLRSYDIEGAYHDGSQASATFERETLGSMRFNHTQASSIIEDFRCDLVRRDKEICTEAGINGEIDDKDTRNRACACGSSNV